jgi:hypothetical protein
MGSGASAGEGNDSGFRLHNSTAYFGPFISFTNPHDELKMACFSQGLQPGVQEVRVTLQWKQMTSSPQPVRKNERLGFCGKDGTQKTAILTSVVQSSLRKIDWFLGQANGPLLVGTEP